MWSSDIVFFVLFLGRGRGSRSTRARLIPTEGGRLIRNVYNLFTVLYHDRLAVYHVRPPPVREGGHKGWARERSCMECMEHGVQVQV